MKQREFIWVTVLVLFFMMVGTLGVLAQGGPGENPPPTLAAWNPDAGELPTDPRGVLVWIVGGGAVLVANAVLAYAYARWPWFAALDGFEKRALAWLTSIAISSAAYALLNLSADFWARGLAFWPYFVTLALGLIGQQSWYHLREKPNGIGL